MISVFYVFSRLKTDINKKKPKKQIILLFINYYEV